MNAKRDPVLDQLIREEWPRLRRFFHTKVPESEVLDLVQNTLLAFVEGRPRVAGPEKAYLWGIARLQVLKLYERQRPVSQFDSTKHTAMDLGPNFSSRLDSRSRLLEALHTLPIDQQMAFELRHCEDLSLEETASAMGVSLATIKRYLAAALAKLRRELGDQMDETVRGYTQL